MLVFVLLATATLVSVEGLIIPGNCSNNVPVQQNFNVDSYAGKWYEMFRYEQTFEQQMECVTATYTKRNDGVGVFNQGVVENKLKGINGTAIVNSNMGEGKLLVTFPTNTSASNYWVLETDYNSYSVVYSCQTLNNVSRSISGWVLSRKNFTSMVDMEKIVKAIDSRKSVTGLDWKDFRHTIHDTEVCKNSSSVVYPSFMMLMALILAKFF